ncbi:two-component system response regulator [Nitratiruptor sp. YY08-26]|uniref:response regulator transcription factor n=1 Tax=unclassified Nitratiruptor TaxID=2624044 RepID=UPI00191608DC|nr:MULTISPECIES: response regulator transcription factor [unclassified Nitratiruptor]BCD62931.1 two-component system response regulator [Nitratiruptor sp. YY08-13]BCD66866.1 two-component system response regulator [Nitratiruptor sp. YY08-26]
MHILLIEDDRLLADSLRDFLMSEGFHVDVGYSGEEALDKTFQKKYDLYLFDINLSGESGLQIIKELKEADDDTPVIFITALTTLDTIAQAFELGAIDYIKKPFPPEELLIRIKSKFKQPQQQNFLTYENLQLDPTNHIVKVDGHPETIGEIQFKILQTLIENRNEIVPKERLLSHMNNPSDVALRVTINKLKNRYNLPIKNIRSKGYFLE